MCLNRGPDLPLCLLAGFDHDLLKLIQHDESLAAIRGGKPLDSVQDVREERDFGAASCRLQAHAHGDLSIRGIEG